MADNWRPLFAVAQIIGGHWPQRVLEAFNQLTAQHSSSPNLQPSTFNLQPSSANLQLLSDLRQIFLRTGAERLFSSAIVDHLRSLPDRPWSGTRNGDVPMDESCLARNLREFGIRPRTLRIANHQAKGYDIADFAPAFAHFLKSETFATWSPDI